MEIYKTFSSSKKARRAEKNYRVFFKIPDKKIFDMLKFINYGKLFPEIYMEHLEQDWEKRISKTCKIDEQTVSSALNVILNILRGFQRKRFIVERASDLKRMGFEQSDIKRFLKIATTLRKNEAQKEIRKFDKWVQMSAEVIPRLMSIEYVYDIRCDTVRGKIETFLPLVLVKFETQDGSPYGKELVFQMDIGTLRRVARNFAEMYRNAKPLKEYVLKMEESRDHARQSIP